MVGVRELCLSQTSKEEIAVFGKENYALQMYFRHHVEAEGCDYITYL